LFEAGCFIFSDGPEVAGGWKKIFHIIEHH